ncbi:MAG: glycine cleavage system protein GcvH [Proteobacteria bacterium]|nr:glycine cleavage system protein GcvH [Pseudomonadota bacterium]
MSTLYFSEEHEWILVEGDSGTVGITDYAQEQLGDIVFVEVSKVGEEVAKDDDVGVVESVKAASDIYCPVSGTITEANDVLDGAPETVNADPMAEGWMFKITLSDAGELDGLMDRDAYKTFCATL